MCQIDFDAMDIRRHFATSCTFALSIFIMPYIRGESHSLHVASALLFEQHLIPTLRASFCLDLPVSSRLEMRRIKKRDGAARRGATRYGGSVCSRARCRQQTVNCSLKPSQAVMLAKTYTPSQIVRQGRPSFSAVESRH